MIRNLTQATLAVACTLGILAPSAAQATDKVLILRKGLCPGFTEQLKDWAAPRPEWTIFAIPSTREDRECIEPPASSNVTIASSGYMWPTWNAALDTCNANRDESLAKCIVVGVVRFER